MNKRCFSMIAGGLTAAAGAALTVQLLVLSATPPSGPLAAASLRHTVVSAPPVVAADEFRLTASRGTAPRRLIRADGSKVEMPPPPPDGAPAPTEPPSVTRADGSVAQIFTVTLDDGTFGTREKVTRKKGNKETIETTDWNAQGEIVSASTSTSSSVVTANFLTPVSPSGPPVLPVAFQETPPGSVLLTPDQAAAAEQVQDQFITDSGSGSADPSTPAYSSQWRQSQSVADQRLRAAIGGQAFARWQMEAYLSKKKSVTDNPKK